MAHSAGRDRIYRKVSYGPLLDVFCLDMRTYRGANPKPDVAGPVAMLGEEQAGVAGPRGRPRRRRPGR